MNIDVTAMPATIDLLHVSLVTMTLIFFILFLIKSKRKIPDATEISESPAVAEPLAEPLAEHVTEPLTTSQLKKTSPDSALQLLALLQQEARFIDFIQEDLLDYSDADIGAAARVVHEGGQKVLKEYFSLAAVREEQEESRISLPDGFDATAIRLTGNVIGQAPYTGTLVHRGWKATEVKLPKLVEGHDVSIIAPAEVGL